MEAKYYGLKNLSHYGRSIETGSDTLYLSTRHTAELTFHSL
jgi:hypothetical protein